MHAGQSFWLPAPYPVPFWLQRVSLLRWVNLTMALHPFACAVLRCLLDGIPSVRLPGSAVYPRCKPLRTSRGLGGYACTPAPRGRDLHPHGELSYKARGFAVCLRTLILFRPTGRTKCKFLYDGHMVRWRPLASPPGVHRQERSPRRNIGAILPRPRRAACHASACHCCCPAVSASSAKTSSRMSLTQSQRQPCTPNIAATRGTPAARSASASKAPSTPRERQRSGAGQRC